MDEPFGALDAVTRARLQDMLLNIWSGNVLLTIAEKKGYFDEVGIKLEEVPATANASAMTLLSTGMVDVVSNAGTSNPLQQNGS